MDSFVKKTFSILFSSLIVLHAGGCVAEDTINLSILPDPFTRCLQYGADIAITENSTLGVMPAICNNRPTFGVMHSQVSNTFRRIMAPWRFSPHGAFKDGYFVDAAIGAEKSEYRTAAGSSANVTFIDTGFHFGYQWFWHDGWNLSAVVGIAHLIRVSGDKNIVPAENGTIAEYIDRQTYTTTHAGTGIFLGWVF